MYNVVLVYKQLSMQFVENGLLVSRIEDKEIAHVLFYDEKLGIQMVTSKSFFPMKPTV